MFDLWWNVSNSSDSVGAIPLQETYNLQEHFHRFLSYPLLLLVLVLAGVTGNILVCIPITIESELQNITNHFLLSLAVADLFVCVIVMPASIANELIGHWPFGLIACDLYQVLDVMMCTSSIMHMCTISLDCYVTISDPLKTCRRSSRGVSIKVNLDITK